MNLDCKSNTIFKYKLNEKLIMLNITYIHSSEFLIEQKEWNILFSEYNRVAGILIDQWPI